MRPRCSVRKSCSVAAWAPGHQRPRLGAGTDLGLLGREGGGHLREEFLSDGCVDEQGLEGVARAGSLALRVEHDLFGHREVGLRVDVDVADAGVVLDDGDLGVIDHRLDEAGSAAGDDDVDDAAQGAEGGHGFAVGEGQERDGLGGQAGGAQAGRERLRQRDVRVDRLAAAAEHAAVAGLQAEGGGVDGDVGTRFEDDGDEADRDAAADDAQAVGAGPILGDFADRVGELRDGFTGDRDVLKAGVVETQAVGHRVREALGLGGSEILDVGLEDDGFVGAEGLGGGAQGGVTDGGRGEGEGARGLLGRAGDLRHALEEVANFFCSEKRVQSFLQSASSSRTF